MIGKFKSDAHSYWNRKCLYITSLQAKALWSHVILMTTPLFICEAWSDSGLIGQYCSTCSLSSWRTFYINHILIHTRWRLLLDFIIFPNQLTASKCWAFNTNYGLWELHGDLQWEMLLQLSWKRRWHSGSVFVVCSLYGVLDCIMGVPASMHWMCFTNVSNNWFKSF